ncbi:phosphatase PAP2 family protein [Haloarcula sp. S1CR25-12]|uniref:Phosphatase PAP2 family protein n=1 Tax=Haloarcula saliterrae TaxID=2950534 RepID=A0ABU2FFW6_9EURY|nr:phosphatase PAP2 family protein [Haloarcula sp. S1CR25-12]MDS0260600.1 phosphatase PAP2 family protein [Haloarcula sp. S1CR25-12]
MGVVAVFLEVVAVLSLLLTVSLTVVVGRGRLRAAASELPARLRMAAKPIGLLVVVLAINSRVRTTGVDLSWIIGVNITRLIYTLEGTAVATIQSIVPGWLTLYFGYVYVYGYAFLLVFPLLAGMLAAERRLLRQTAVAYAINYTIGMVCYLLFIAYGPRNYMPALVEPLLFDTLPRFQLLTSEVNANTNVFPSLHTSLSVTVALLAIRDHETFPKWTPVAVFLAASIVLSTMVLGIHWATDVVAGSLLAAFSVWVVSSARVGPMFDRLGSLTDSWRSLTDRWR